MSPVVVMKKISLRRAEELDLTRNLPELHDCDESQVLRELGTQSQSGSGKNQSVVTTDYENAFVDGLAPEDLNNHIQKCLEMSSENKITLKNAFALQLIDCMKFLMQKKDFSAMACTLDAGTKIYSCRVDSLHQQVRKLADEVVMNRREGQKDNSDRSATEGKTAKEKRRATKKFIISSAESLRRKPVGKDPRDKFVKIEGRAGALSLSARTDPKDLSLTIENSIPFWPKWDTYRPLKAEGSVVLPQIKVFRDKANKLERFDELSQRSGNKHDFETEGLKESVLEIDDYDGNSQDINNSGSNLAEETVVSMDSVDNLNESKIIDTNKNEQEVNVISTALKRMQDEAEEFGVSEPPSRLKAMKIIFADVNDDYNYFNIKSVNYWAGPNFWKRPNKINQNNNDAKKKSTSRKKYHKEIVYQFDGLEEKWRKMFKKGHSLGNKALHNWKKQKTTLPSDLKAKVDTFIDLFHISLSHGKVLLGNEPDTPEKTTLKQDISSLKTECEERNDQCIDTSDSQQDSLNDCFYNNAPENSSSSEDRDQLNSCFYDPGLIPQSSSRERRSGNVFKVEINCDKNVSDNNFLVPAPRVVSFKPIKYSARPIRVDMQHLKETMKEIIHNEIENAVEFQRSQPHSSSMELPDSRPRATFSNIVKSLPKKLDRISVQDVSPAMAFLALLTLANENNLHLESNNQLNDVLVKLETDKEV